jgi:linoleoyl-CoA desaturase
MLVGRDMSGPLEDATDEELVRRLHELGRRARSLPDRRDLALLRALKWSTRAADLGGRICLYLASGPLSWMLGAALVSYYLAVEAQLNHSIMHGAYARVPGAGRFTPERYETLAIPFQSRTWRDAHRIHHARPSIVADDPDTTHSLFRVHEATPWRHWHFLNTWIGALLTFECWAFDYDHFLKKAGKRDARDRSEIKKLAIYFFYQYVLFTVIAGERWKSVLAGAIVATVVRNLIFTGLQLASSVGRDVSTAHAIASQRKTGAAYHRFQIETSKNFVLRGIWRVLSGGLDRHIEHHLFPYLPPSRLGEVSDEVREICRRHGIRYAEFPSVWSSLKDSLAHLANLSLPRRR